jgi:urate oxidase
MKLNLIQLIEKSTHEDNNEIINDKSIKDKILEYMEKFSDSEKEYFNDNKSLYLLHHFVIGRNSIDSYSLCTRICEELKKTCKKGYSY